MSNSVPEGWSLHPLSALANYYNGRAFKPDEWSSEGLPIIRIAQINNRNTDLDYYAGNDVSEKNRIRNGDLLFSWSATLTALIWDRGDAVLNQHIFKVEEKSGIDRSFLHQVILSSIDPLAEHSHGSTMKHIKKGVLDEYCVETPPFPEQKRIAAILSSVDDVIEKTRAQIDKLKDLKTGMMQELLTKGIGHTEFKDSAVGRIPAQWEMLRVGGFLSERKARGFDGLPIYSVLMEGGMVPRNTVDRRVTSGLDSSENRLAKRGDLAYNMMRMWQGASGIAPVDCLVSPAYVVCKPSERIHSDFLGYMLKSPSVIQLLHRYSQGLTGDRLRLYFDSFKQIRMAVPPRDEQVEIADTLKALDNEIDTKLLQLSSRLNLKRALMQDLLTGKVRVKIDEKEKESAVA